MVHLFVVYGYQGAEEDAEKLRLTDRLLQAVLAEAQVVCIGQPMLIAGDLNADPAVIPCLAKGMSAGRYVDLALAHSLGAGSIPDITCAFNRVDGSGSRGDSLLAVPMPLLLPRRAMLQIGGLLSTFLFLHAFVLMRGWLMSLARLLVGLSGLLAGWILLIDSSSSSRVVQDVWDVYRDVLGVVPDEVVRSLRDAATGTAIDDFWSIWSTNAEAGLFRAYTLAGGPITGDSAVFLGRGSLRIRHRRLGGKAVGGRGSSRLYRVSHGDEVDSNCAQFFCQFFSFSCFALS